ncbi:MFS transporter [Cytobacillus firmus]
MQIKTSFRFLWIGQSIANLGDILYIVSIISIVYEITGSAFYMALFPFVNTVSRFISGFIAPILLERYRTKPLLAFSQFGKTIIVLMLTVNSIYLFSIDNIIFTFVFVMFISFLDGWASPARDSLIPRYFDSEEKLVKVNSFLSIVDQTITLGGWPAAGILITLLGSGNLLIITTILFVISTIFMFLIKDLDRIEDELNKDEQESEKMTKKVLLEGWNTIWKTPSLRTITIVEFTESIANVVWVAAILYIYVEEVLQVSENWWGYINSSFFAGLMIAGFISLKWSQTITNNLRFVIISGAFLTSITTLIFGLISTPWLALVISLFFGFGSQIKGVAQQTIVQTSVNSKLLSKVYSAQDSIVFGTFGVSTILFGIFADQFGVRLTFLLAAFLLFASAFFVSINQKTLKHIKSGEINK